MMSERTLLIVTKHGKEAVIAPEFEKLFGLKTIVTTNFDTDVFGTFSGEVARKSDPIATAREKCIRAMDIFNYDMAVSSEGSFGIHPSFPFAYTDEEILFFIDKQNGLEISAREISTETNFDGKQINTLSELERFADLAQFPSHALILRASKEDSNKIIKGINRWDWLRKEFHWFMTSQGGAFVETDMRGRFNPSRMKVIQKVTQRLVEKINTRCPHCSALGFGVTGYLTGLPCGLCREPTRAVLAFIYTCQKCTFSFQKEYPYAVTWEDPAYCDRCNP